MLIIKNHPCLKTNEKRMLHCFCHYVMDHFCQPAVQKNATIIIKFVDPRTIKGSDRKDLKDYKAWSIYDGVDSSNNKKHFTIIVATGMLTARRHTKKMIKRLKDVMLCIGHELVHVKQVLNNEVFDYKNGDIRWRGERYTDWEQGEGYYFSPWEIEAYGHEQGLYKCFEMKQEKLSG